MLARRTAFDRVGPLRTDLKAEFVEWYLRAREAGLGMRILDGLLVKRRIHSSNFTLLNQDVPREYVQLLKASLDRRRAKADGKTARQLIKWRTTAWPRRNRNKRSSLPECARGSPRRPRETGEIVRDFRVAGTSVRLRFAGEALTSEIVPGLAGLEPGRHRQRLTARSAFGIRNRPALRWRRLPGRGKTSPGAGISGVSIVLGTAPRTTGVRVRVNVMDREARQAAYWVPSSRTRPCGSCRRRCGPFFIGGWNSTAVNWYTRRRGAWRLRGTDAGARRIGQVFDSLACLLAGMDFLADDYLALALDPEPRLYRLLFDR